MYWTSLNIHIGQYFIMFAHAAISLAMLENTQHLTVLTKPINAQMWITCVSSDCQAKNRECWATCQYNLRWDNCNVLANVWVCGLSCPTIPNIHEHHLNEVGQCLMLASIFSLHRLLGMRWNTREGQCLHEGSPQKFCWKSCSYLYHSFFHYPWEFSSY